MGLSPDWGQSGSRGTARRATRSPTVSHGTTTHQGVQRLQHLALHQEPVERPDHCPPEEEQQRVQFRPQR